MQVCRKFIAYYLAAIFLFAGTGNMLFAESIEMPAMPQISGMSMPDMPSITAPTMDGKFYRPSLPQQTNNTAAKKETSTSENKSTETVITDGTSTDDILISLLSNANLLSASDISDLYDIGSFTSLSSITGLSGLTSSAVSSSNVSNLSTNILLRQILEKLNELKVEQNTAPAAQQEMNAAKIQDSQNFKIRNPSILRFKINNYNIKDSIIETFFSEPETDGSFLLTADRKYFVNNKATTETFYMLFKAVKSNGSTTTFSVTPSIAQGIENKDSYVYKLCHCKNLTAEKTGNLVVIHHSGDDISADLLLDIDK